MGIRLVRHAFWYGSASSPGATETVIAANSTPQAYIWLTATGALVSNAADIVWGTQVGASNWTESLPTATLSVPQDGWALITVNLDMEPADNHSGNLRIKINGATLAINDILNQFRMWHQLSAAIPVSSGDSIVIRYAANEPVSDLDFWLSVEIY